MNIPFFTSLSSQHIASRIKACRKQLCYVAPGIHEEPADAIVALRALKPDVRLTVSLDVDESTLRMGYGSLEAVEKLRSSGIEIGHSPGFRSAVLIVDDEGWVFTPTALYLQPEPQSEETPNAMCLTKEQIHATLIRLSPHAREEAIVAARTPGERSKLESTPLEIGELSLAEAQFSQVKSEIAMAPSVKFDLVRQVRVFEPYLQYVELSLTGAAIQRRRISIPESLQNLGSSEDLEGRLKTTFALVEKGGALSSKHLEDGLNKIRKELTPSLGQDHGRVVLKAAKPRLLERLELLRAELEEHQQKVRTELQGKLDESRKQVVDHYFPLAKNNPPDALIGGLLNITDESIQSWLESELAAVFPSAGELINRMAIEDRFKDVTFETLNRDDFLISVKTAFPRIDWDKAHREFKAAGEKQ